MPATKWTIDRTEQKFRYSHIHLEELVNYSARGSNNDWEHAHEEACMYHLVGAIEGTFQEMNSAYALALPLDQVNLSELKRKAAKDARLKAALNVYSVERDSPTGWLSLLYALRNSGAHQRYIGHVVNTRSVPDNRFADPRTVPPTEVKGATTDVLAQFEGEGRAFVDRIRQTYP